MTEIITNLQHSNIAVHGQARKARNCFYQCLLFDSVLYKPITHVNAVGQGDSTRQDRSSARVLGRSGKNQSSLLRN